MRWYRCGFPAGRSRVEPDERPSAPPGEWGQRHEERIMKITSALPLLAPLALAGVLASGAAAAGSGSTLVIRHQLKGCHSWSANGDTYKASQTMKLQRGASL